MALYRRLLLLRRLSHLHPAPAPAPAISSPPPPTLARLLTPLGRRHFAFSTAEEAAAERRRRKRRLRIEPPLHALRRDSPAPRDPNASRLPDTTSALVGPRLSLHNRVQFLIRSGDLDGASTTARAAVSSRVRPTVFTSNAVGAAMVRAARHNDAVELFDFFFKRSNIVPNIVSYNTLILAHCEAGRVDAAVEVHHEIMKSAPFSPSAVTYRHLTKGFVSAGRIGDALDLLHQMLNRGAGADSVVYNNLIAGYIDLDDWDKAFELFNDLAERCFSLLHKKFKMTPTTCNVLLETLFKHDKHKEANDLWETMMDNHTPPSFIGINAESYNVMVNQCFKEGKFQRAVEVFHRQPRKNVQMDVGCFNNIIGKLCENGMLAEAEKLFEEMETKSVLPDVYTYTYLVDSCFKEGRVDDTMQYFYKMADGREHGPKFNIGFFNRMFEGLTEVGRIDDASKDADRQEEIEKAFEEKALQPQPRVEYRPPKPRQGLPGFASNQTSSNLTPQQGQPWHGAQSSRPGLGVSQMLQPEGMSPKPQQPVFGSLNRVGETSVGGRTRQYGFGAPQVPQPGVRAPVGQAGPPPAYGTSRPWQHAVGAAQVQQPAFSSAPPVQPGFVYSQPQQATFSVPQNQQPAFDPSRSWQSGYGASQVQQPGYGAPHPSQIVGGSPQPPQQQFGTSHGVPGHSQMGNQHDRFGPPQGEPEFGIRSQQSGSQIGPQGQWDHVGPQGPPHASNLPHNQASFGVPHGQNNNRFTHEQPNVVASQGQPVAGKFESESRSGGSYGQPRNGHSHHQTGFQADN
ncbi:hypothetical protein QOZ80_1AG0002250 [Eleusine coracana subsp. coracana]|nr:hypothetical protein QOZ80_1AG0002250 [Eleusine coracana subsp. coracana]